MRFLRCSLFLMFSMVLWGFNYSKMANYRFLIDSTTFWMILELPEFRHFLDPQWTLEPRICHEFTSKNTRKIWEHFVKYEFWISENLRISKESEVLCT